MPNEASRQARRFRYSWLFRRNPLTIAAAFRFETGILLCADTQYTSGAKIEETKIFTIKYHAATAVLVLTGRATYAKRAVEQITNSMKSLPEDELSKSNIQDAIES